MPRRGARADERARANEERVRVAAYVYPGWHATPERDRSFHPGFTEWELVQGCRPGFPGHAQPRVPLLGTYDDTDPVEVARRIQLARDHGVDAFVYGLFWCRGKRVFEDALDRGFLLSTVGSTTPFAVMWANRMPRRILPVRDPSAGVIDSARQVPSDVEDFTRLVQMAATSYFCRDNYVRVAGATYFSIYDSTFFLRELGVEWARVAIARARDWMREAGFGELHLAAIEPSTEVIGALKEVGFDSVTHYVLLPDWRGPSRQDYAERAAISAARWPEFALASGLRYMPSVSPRLGRVSARRRLRNAAPGQVPMVPRDRRRAPRPLSSRRSARLRFCAAQCSGRSRWSSSRRSTSGVRGTISNPTSASATAG